MKIHIEKDIEVPEGFYCNQCVHAKGYDCRAYDKALAHSPDGTKYVKNTSCLLAYRESLMEG